MGDGRPPPSDPPLHAGPGQPDGPYTAPTAADQVAAAHGLGALVQVRMNAQRGPKFFMGCGTSVVALALIPVVAGAAEALEHGLVDAVARPLLIALIAGVVLGGISALRGLASAKEHFHFYERGLVYTQGGNTDVIPWQEMGGLDPHHRPGAPAEDTTVTGYHLVVRHDIELDLMHPPNGTDPFVDWIVATLRHYGRPVG